MKARPEEIFYAAPYLQNPTEGGITVMWQTRVPTYSWVEYGTDTLNLKKARTIVDGQVICNGLHNKIRLTDLRPGQTGIFCRHIAVGLSSGKASLFNGRFGVIMGIVAKIRR